MAKYDTRRVDTEQSPTMSMKHSGQRLLCLAFAVFALSAAVATADPGATNAVAAVANDGTAAVANVPGQADQNAAETVQQPVTFTTKSFANADTTIFEATDEWQEVGDNQQLTPVRPQCRHCT